MIPHIPYWRLSVFYLFYFAALGAMVPYWPIYLESKGFDAQGIGMLIAIMMASRIFAPYIWGWLADKAKERMSIVRWGAFLAMIFFAVLFSYDKLWWFALFLLVHSFFWNALLAQFEVVTLDYLGNKPQEYSRIRLWGSVGFTVAVVGLGSVFDIIPITWLPWFVLGIIASVLISSLTIKDAEHHAIRPNDGEKIIDVVKKPEVICFFFACFLMQISHGPYYTFFSLYMEQVGYSRTVVGQLWALGVVAEVVLFWFMYKLLPYWGLRFFIVLSLFLATLRWSLLALYPENLLLLLFAQVLHAFTFGSFHAACIELVRRLFPRGAAGRGQALYNSVGFGFGTVVGALMSGYLWDWSNKWTFLAAAIASGLGCLIAYFGVRDVPIDHLDTLSYSPEE